MSDVMEQSELRVVSNRIVERESEFRCCVCVCHRRGITLNFVFSCMSRTCLMELLTNSALIFCDESIVSKVSAFVCAGFFSSKKKRKKNK